MISKRQEADRQFLKITRKDKVEQTTSKSRTITDADKTTRDLKTANLKKQREAKRLASRQIADEGKTQMIDLHEFRARVEKTVADLHRDNALMESGQIKMNSKNGDEPWRDVTRESIARNKSIISTYELILAGVDKRLRAQMEPSG
jgi:hypothetical protein